MYFGVEGARRLRTRDDGFHQRTHRLEFRSGKDLRRIGRTGRFRGSLFPVIVRMGIDGGER